MFSSVIQIFSLQKLLGNKTALEGDHLKSKRCCKDYNVGIVGHIEQILGCVDTQSHYGYINFNNKKCYYKLKIHLM